MPSRAARARLDVDDSDGSVLDRDEHVSGIDKAWSEEPTAAEFCLGGAEVPRLITRAERDRRRRKYHLAQRVTAKKTQQNATKARDAMRHSARGGVWTDSRTPTATGLHSTHLLRVCGGVVFCPTAEERTQAQEECEGCCQNHVQSGWRQDPLIGSAG